jgi:pilus assembly protein CpaC
MAMRQILPIRSRLPVFRTRVLFRAALAAVALTTMAGAATVAGTTSGNTFVELNRESAMLHVTLGHSMFLNTVSRLRRVYVSNPAVLASFTASPHQVLITAKEPGISSLVVWDEFGRSSVYTVSSDVDVDGLRAALHDAFPHDDIQVAALQDRITLSGLVATEAESEGAAKLASAYGKEVANSLRLVPVHVKQVRLKVCIAEVDRTKAEQFGFNFLSNGSTSALASTQQFGSFGTTTLGGASAASTTVTPLNLLLFNNSANVAADIADLEQKNIMQILAEPTITALSGESASFLSGGEFPFPVVQGGASGYTGVTVEFRPYGVKLDFTPYVNPDGTIRLKVAPEVSALDYTNEVSINGYDIPALDTRRAQTEVELKSGQSFAISGLLDHRLTDEFSSMPGIASIPIIGRLFRSKNNTKTTTDLMVIVTPEIVDPLSTPLPPPLPPKVVLPYMDKPQFDRGIQPKKKKTQGPPPPMPQEP